MIYAAFLCLIFATKLYATDDDNPKDRIIEDRIFGELIRLVTDGDNPEDCATSSQDFGDIKKAEDKFWEIARELSQANSYPFNHQDLLLIISSNFKFFTSSPHRFNQLIDLIKLAEYIGGEKDKEEWYKRYEKLVLNANRLCGLNEKFPFNEENLLRRWEELTNLSTYTDFVYEKKPPPPYWGVIKKLTNSPPLYSPAPPTYWETIMAQRAEF